MNPLILGGLLLVSGCAWGAVDDREGLRLIPYPKESTRLPGVCSLARPLVFEGPAGHVEAGARLLNDELRLAGLGAAQVRTNASLELICRLTAGGAASPPPALPPGDHPEAYALEVRAGEIVWVARAPAGLHYGLQSLRQLLRANLADRALACLAIRDWPSLRWRCFQDDLTRGPSSRRGTLEFEVALASFLKLNLMTYYMEYQYAFRKHPQIGPPDGSLTPEDLASLVSYARPLQVDILGNQQSFGHFAHILKHPEFAGLRETADVLTPVREETYGLLNDLYAEVCPLVPFPWFNVCCDETYGLGTGPARDLASQIGVGGVYVRHIRRVHDLLKEKHGKRMMMWGDIILQHPDRLSEIPKDTLMLTWGYDARPSFEDQIVPFARSGYEFFVCPGVNNWSRILPDFGVAVTNIHHFVRDGVKHGALGMINTDWEDDGEALNAVKWHADAWAAECAWNGAATSIESFNRRVGAVLFGEAGDHFGRAVELLTLAHRQPAMKGMFNSRFWEADFTPASGPAAVQAAASNLLAVVRPALRHLEACRAEARCHHHVLDVYLFGARRMERIGQRMLDGLEAAQLYGEACEAASTPARTNALGRIELLIRRNRDAHEALGREFAALWLAESKPYALDWTLRRYTNVVARFDALSGRIAAARADAEAGRGLPAPEEIGLAVPRPLARRLQPRETAPAPLMPDLPWADPTATHRLGLVVHAGEADRFQLPVEVELALPPSCVGKPARAFILEAAGSPQELPAQVDARGAAGKARLVLVLSDPLPKGQRAALHVYLGIPGSPPSLPGAVRTWTDAQGAHWVENDRIRAQAGSEGAHLYRWEVKSAGGRDLTMPGETGWAGFSDIGSKRTSVYRLTCTGRGPALVELECTDGDAHQKTLRFYSGASWVEVLLSEPTPVYWDFDDPKNFAADGPTPGSWLFSNGQTGALGRESDGVPAQVKASGTFWGIKFTDARLALGLVTPGAAAFHHVAPGAGAGGVGIEGSPPAQHFVTFAGRIETSPAETMLRLQTTLDLKRPVSVQVHALQGR